MSREIIEFVQELERDKGIESDTLIEALEDALLAAYKKTPGASRHAVVELDREEGDFRVIAGGQKLGQFLLSVFAGKRRDSFGQVHLSRDS